MKRRNELNLKHNTVDNSSDTVLIPSRDGRTVTVQQIMFPIEHRECGYYWLTSSRKRLISCPGCRSTISRQRNLTIFRGPEESQH